MAFRPPRSWNARTSATLVVMNRNALDAALLGIGDALYDKGLDIAADASASAPRDPAAAIYRSKRAGHPVRMLADTAGVGVWVNGLRIAGAGYAPGKLATPPGEAVLAVGFGSPLAHLVELGTVKMTARPFMAPAWNRGFKGLAEDIPVAMGKRIAEVPE